MGKFVLAVALFLTAVCSGAASVVQSNMAFTGGATSLSATFSSTPTVGNIIIVGAETGNNTIGVYLVTDNQSPTNVYPLMNILPLNSAISAQLYCGIVKRSTGTFTITITPNSSQVSTLFIIEVSGSGCVPDQISSASGTTSPYSCGTITTQDATTNYLVTVINNNGGGTVNYTAPTGFTKEQEQTNGGAQSGAIADMIVSGTGTFSPTWGVSVDTGTHCVLLSLMPSGSSPPPPSGGTISAVFP